MIYVAKMVKALIRCQSGAAAVEYSVIAFAMFGAIIPAFIYVSSSLGMKLTNIISYFNPA